ncbi:MAG: DNA polymerase III subunit delta [Lachnospiraceae bacterium]|nr:DNA polymerase III subunit delta [Lachnospiraceae bacterium]
MKKLWDEIKTGNLSRCYIFYGTEQYLKKQYENRLRQEFSNDIAGDMNISIFNGEADVNSIIDAAETMPFFADKRLILVKDSKLFKVGRKNDSEEIADYIEKIPQSTCLVFIEDEVDKRGKLYKVVAKAGRGVEFKTPEEKELIVWAQKQLKRSGVDIDTKTAVYFFSCIGSGMENAESELAKLAAYKGKGGVVSTENIDEICTRSLEAKVFDLVDAIGQRKTDKAVEIYRGMLMAKEAPMMILTMITRQFRLMLQCRVLLEAGTPQPNIGNVLGQKDFVVRKCIAQAKNFTVETLKNAMKDCLEADIGIKTGEIKDDLAAEMIVIKYSN